MTSTLKDNRTIYQLSIVGTWYENIAVRPNGHILATRIDKPVVDEIDPVKGTGSPVVGLPDSLGFTGLTGIAEIRPDVFAIGAGQYKFGVGPVPGSWEVFTLDLTSPDGIAQTQSLLAIPEIGLLNGLTKFDDNTLLAADSEFGALYKIDVPSATYTKLLSAEDGDTALGSPEGVPMQIGINGVKVRDGFLYFTNTMRQSFYRVPLDASAKPTGPVETVASGFSADDFAFGPDGTAYITTHITNEVVAVAPGGHQKEAVVISGHQDTLEIAGSTAAAFGRGTGEADDSNVLYVVTAGGLSQPVKGQVEPAKVVAIDLA